MDKRYMRFSGKNKFDPETFKGKEEECGLNKKNYLPELEKNMLKMSEYQDKFYAHHKDSMLIIFQAMDAAGKDGMIKHVMTTFNPQGTVVSSFKKPSTLELDHTYMWRCFTALPERGRIGIFNRSYYEDVLVAKVHNLPAKQGLLPERCLKGDIWKTRYRQICDIERYLHENGVTILKFFLNITKDEQKKRFMDRIENDDKNWKFSSADISERSYWDNYQNAYKDAINNTSTAYAPWYVIPSDKKWYARLAVSEIINEAFKKIDPQYPRISDDEHARLLEAKELLLSEK